MWTDKDKCLLRQQHRLSTKQQQRDKGIHHHCAAAFPVVLQETYYNRQKKCNSPFSQVWSYMRRVLAREQHERWPHNLNYCHYAPSLEQQQYFSGIHYESFAGVYEATTITSTTTTTTPLPQLNSLQRKFGEFMNDIAYAELLNPYRLMMLQQQREQQRQQQQQCYRNNSAAGAMMFTPSTSTSSRCKTPQLPKLISLDSNNFTARQPAAQSAQPTVAAALSSLFSDRMSTLTHSLLTSTQVMLGDLLAAFLPATSAASPCSQAPVVGSAASSCSKPTPPTQSKMSPPEEIAFIEFFARPTYCYFVIDICAHSLSETGVWPSEKSSAVGIPPACERGDNSDANNNSRCSKESSSSYKCSPNDDDWPSEMTAMRRQRSISDCSDESFICFRDEDDDPTVDDEFTDSDSEEEEDEDEDDDDDGDDDDDDDEGVVEDARVVRSVSVCQRLRGKFTNADLATDLKPLQITQYNKNKNNLAQRPGDSGSDSPANRDRTVDKSVNRVNGDTLPCWRNDCHGAAVSACDKQQQSSAATAAQAKKVKFDLTPTVHTMRAWDYAYRAARISQWEKFARDRTRFWQRIKNTAAYLNPILTPQHRSKVYNMRFTTSEEQQQQQQQTATA